ncbi:hypothetical protein AAC387_Pa09g2292 [Persea americana]
MDPGSSLPNQLDSPSSSNVLRFWEDPIPDFDFPYTQNDPTSSAGHLHPPPFPSAGSSHGTHESLDHLTDNCKLLGLDDKLEIEQGDNYDQSDFNNGLVIGDGNPGTSNAGHDINNPSLCWEPDGQLNCDGCQVLREVIHSNGIDITKLQIHGTVGFLYHGIIEVVLCGAGNEVPVSIHHQLIDFSRYSFEQVKQYLIEYGQMRTREGFSVIEDSLSAFYDCLCVGMSSGDAISTGMLGPDANGTGTWGLDADGIGTSGGDDANLNPSAPVQSVEQSGLDQHAIVEPGLGQLMPTNEESSLARLPRSNIAAQRQRTVKLKLNDLINYFHLPIQLASKRLGLCSTVLKKICRRNGLKRWPYRKIKSIDKNIKSLQQSLAATSGQENASVQAEIEKLQHIRGDICAGILSECNAT